MTDEERLRALVAAVADGTPVDWQRAESGAQSDEERALVRQLHLIATLSDVSRTDEGTRTSEAGEPRAGLLTPAPMLEQWGPLHLRELVGSVPTRGCRIPWPRTTRRTRWSTTA